MVGSIPAYLFVLVTRKSNQKTLQIHGLNHVKQCMKGRVTMKKEDLMKIDGMTDELATKIAEQSAEELKGYIPKTRFDEVNEAKKNAEELVKERDKQLDDLKKSSGDNEELKKQIEQLQEDNKATVKKYEADIKKMQIDNAVQAALKDAGAKNITAAVALLKDLDKAELSDDGTIKGLAEQITELQKSESYLFNTKTESSQNVSGITPAGSGSTHVPGTVTKEQFNRMGYKERNELYNTNKELYDSLVQD